MTGFNPIKSYFDELFPDASANRADLTPIFKEEGIKRKYVVVITGRCGSTWLAHMLKDAGLGNPMEYFNEQSLDHYREHLGASDFSDFVRKAVRAYSANNAFGFKINPTRLFWLSELADLEGSLVRPDVQWIDMRRNNIVKQAISFSRARLTGSWHKYASDKTEGKAEPELPDSIKGSEFKLIQEDIWRNLNNILKQEKSIDLYYVKRNINPMRLLYEDLLDSRSSVFQRVTRSILRADFDPSASPTPESTTIRVSREERWELDFLDMFGEEIEALYLDRSING